MSAVSEEELMRAMFEAARVGGMSIFNTPDVPDDQPFAREWKTFTREVRRLIAEGHRGRFAIIKGDQIVSTWEYSARRPAGRTGTVRARRGFRARGPVVHPASKMGVLSPMPRLTFPIQEGGLWDRL